MAIKKPPQNGKNNGNAPIKSVHRLVSENISWKHAIAFSMSLILAITLYPQILQMAPPEYKVGSIITKDIQADRDFLRSRQSGHGAEKGGSCRKHKICIRL